MKGGFSPPRAYRIQLKKSKKTGKKEKGKGKGKGKKTRRIIPKK